MASDYLPPALDLGITAELGHGELYNFILLAEIRTGMYFTLGFFSIDIHQIF